MRLTPTRRLAAAAALVFAIGLPAGLLTSCDAGLGDPSSAALAILSKHPATYAERLTALDALIRQSQGLPPEPGLAESLMVHHRRLQTASALPPEEALVHLQRFVFDTLGIRPLIDSATVTSSLPSAVLQNRQGSCVGLTLLFLAYAQGLTWPLRPVFLPGHITLRWDMPKGPYLETLRPFVARDSAFYDSAFGLQARPWYRAQTRREPEQALLALTFNLANALRDQGHGQWAEELYALVSARLPGFPESEGNLGLLLRTSGREAEAQKALQTARAGDSIAPARLGLDLTSPR